MEELETIVALYKRVAHEKSLDDKLKYELEDLELEDQEDYVYAKRIKTEMKKKTIFYE